MKEAIILCGGVGSRISDLLELYDIPKPMLQFAGRPFLDILINDLLKKGIEKIYLAIGLKAEKIISYFKQQSYVKNLIFVYEEELLGTGGAIRNILANYNIADNILVINGDSYIDIDIRKLYKAHLQNNNDVTIVTYKEEKSNRFGRLVIKNNLVTQFLEKCDHIVSDMINCGMYAMNVEKFLTSTRNNVKSFSLEREFLEKNFDKLQIGSFVNNNYFIDFGVYEDLERATKEIPVFLRACM